MLQVVFRKPVLLTSRRSNFVICNKRFFQSCSKMLASDEVLFHNENQARVITLNRVSKLNALSTQMCKEITPRLKEYSVSEVANLVIINSNSERAYCSGGDVIQCAKDNLQNENLKSVEFFNLEYNLNFLLSTYNKPVVSFVNGIVMGGGVGVSVHNPFRIVCETTRFAMPEANIGFFSDVGTSFYLSRMDGYLGYYLALTGDELHGIDSFLAGFGTHYVPFERFNALKERLTGLELPAIAPEVNPKDKPMKESELGKRNIKELYPIINETIEEFVDPIPEDYQFKYSKEQLLTIEKCFNPTTHNSVVDVIKSLEKDGSEFSKEILQKFSTRSPVSLNLIFEMLKRSSKTNIYEAIKNELILATNMMINPELSDFNECISKRLINSKSKNPEDKIPKFKYPSVDKVPSEILNKLLTVSPEMIKLSEGSFDNLDLLSPSEKLKQKSNSELDSSNANARGAVLSSIGIENYFHRTYNEYPFHNGLPSQAEIKDYITGNDGSNRQYSVTKSEAIKYFIKKYRGRIGVRTKLVNVLDRKTKGSKFGEEYLEWVD
ncbi:hypothetical protein PACTADRAFT_2527 [Pachysolen tannophilus NRRL Y-2460]|uniref:3-hydroxyisobutyryl-CoA hydrolase n=1 Tax=Pachysolen tannophilus NRRL Y-2460 TaxID=669874 RepID=A0A1E4TWU8_PACTA|nr:hypothetical protein PACTADRAFT_2527 [Pachysolen tannophilus NRRL Y-2460]